MTLLRLQECCGNTPWCSGRGRVRSWSALHTVEQQMAKQSHTHGLLLCLTSLSFFTLVESEQTPLPLEQQWSMISSGRRAKGSQFSCHVQLSAECSWLGSCNNGTSSVPTYWIIKQKIGTTCFSGEMERKKGYRYGLKSYSKLLKCKSKCQLSYVLKTNYSSLWEKCKLFKVLLKHNSFTGARWLLLIRCLSKSRAGEKASGTPGSGNSWLFILSYSQLEAKMGSQLGSQGSHFCH